MFDLVPLAGSRRIVAHRDRHADLIAQSLKLHLPCPLPTAVPTATVSADQEPSRFAVVPPAIHTPPPPDTLDGEFRRFMCDTHVDHCPIACDVVSAVGDRFAFRLTWKIVGCYLIRLPLRHPPPAPIFKGSHQFLL